MTKLMRINPAKALFLVLVFALQASITFSQSTTGLSGSLEASRQIHFYKDPSRALMMAFFPGILIHGYGHFYAKDKMIGTSLLAGEILSLSSIVAGALMQKNPESFSGGIFGSGGNVDTTGRRMVIFGGIGFAVTWFVDMLHAPMAAEVYNNRYNLQPTVFLDRGTPLLALAVRY